MNYIASMYECFMEEKLPVDLSLFTEEQHLQAQSFFEHLQRKEEYQNKSVDALGRNILPLNHSSLLVPRVDDFFDQLFPDLYTKKNPYRCVPTLDIDHAFAFQSKGVFRNLGGWLKNLATDQSRALARIAYWAGVSSDPYDTYQYIIELCRVLEVRPVFFVQMGNYGNGKDVNILFHTAKGKKLIKTLQQYGDVGIHPSFLSNTNDTLLRKEIIQLQDILEAPIKKSRQHFLMLSIPDTYRKLIELGIEEDYTMGWAEQTGFRAGTCRPYKWMDLEKHEFTSLTIFPLVMMDGTLKEYMKLSEDDAKNHASQLIHDIKKRHGVFTPLWHNHTVNDRWEWQGWQSVFEYMLKSGK
jgi:hypothetical protein